METAHGSVVRVTSTNDLTRRDENPSAGSSKDTRDGRRPGRIAFCIYMAVESPWESGMVMCRYASVFTWPIRGKEKNEGMSQAFFCEKWSWPHS